MNGGQAAAVAAVLGSEPLDRLDDDRLGSMQNELRTGIVRAVGEMVGKALTELSILQGMAVARPGERGFAEKFAVVPGSDRAYRVRRDAEGILSVIRIDLASEHPRTVLSSDEDAVPDDRSWNDLKDFTWSLKRLCELHGTALHVGGDPAARLVAADGGRVGTACIRADDAISSERSRRRLLALSGGIAGIREGLPAYDGGEGGSIVLDGVQAWRSDAGYMVRLVEAPGTFLASLEIQRERGMDVVVAKGYGIERPGTVSMAVDLATGRTVTRPIDGGSPEVIERILDVVERVARSPAPVSEEELGIRSSGPA